MIGFISASVRLVGFSRLSSPMYHTPCICVRSTVYTKYERSIIFQFVNLQYSFTPKGSIRRSVIHGCTIHMKLLPSERTHVYPYDTMICMLSVVPYGVLYYSYPYSVHVPAYPYLLQGFMNMLTDASPGSPHDWTPAKTRIISRYLQVPLAAQEKGAHVKTSLHLPRLKLFESTKGVHIHISNYPYIQSPSGPSCEPSISVKRSTLSCAPLSCSRRMKNTCIISCIHRLFKSPVVQG